jgi:hypothetical protein
MSEARPLDKRYKRKEDHVAEQDVKDQGAELVH